LNINKGQFFVKIAFNLPFDISDRQFCSFSEEETGTRPLISISEPKSSEETVALTEARTRLTVSYWS